MIFYLKWLSNIENFFIGLIFIFKWKFGLITPTSKLYEPLKNKTVTFVDHFEKNKIDLKKWNYSLPWGNVNREVKSYCKTEENITIKDSIIKFNVKKESGTTEDWSGTFNYDYTHSCITTNDKFYQTYGRWDACIKVSKNKRLWPAFWLLTKVWGDGRKESILPEIDIIEHFGGENHKYKDMQFTYHCGQSYQKPYHKQFPTDIKYLDFSKDFFVYSIEWTTRGIKWYVNNSLVKILRFDYLNDDNDIANKPCFIILNDIVNFEDGDKYENEYSLPDGMEVDWVRVYK